MSYLDNENEEVAGTTAQAQPVEDNAAPAKKSNEVAYISSVTKIEGKITTEGSLVLMGEIQGDINAVGSVQLNGKIDGNIDCGNLIVNSSATSQDINVADNVILKADTVTIGNIVCRNITVYGKFVGNINASESVVLKNTADVDGDITAGRIGIESGAKISGKVEIQ